MEKSLLRRLQDERGQLLLIFAVVSALAGLIGGLAAMAIFNRSDNCADVMRRVDSNEPVTEAELETCRSQFADQARIATAAGNFVNAVDPVPNAGNVVTQYASGGISNYVDRASTPAPSAGNPLPLDAQGQGGNPQGCASGIYTCNSGQRICREKVCNGSSDCGDGSDEAPIINCAEQGSCCITTNGCPGETATACGETCCCCPFGQKCSSDHSAGCVNSP
jgi:hypothetical protein